LQPAGVPPSSGERISFSNSKRVQALKSASHPKEISARTTGMPDPFRHRPEQTAGFAIAVPGRAILRVSVDQKRPSSAIEIVCPKRIRDCIRDLSEIIGDICGKSPLVYEIAGEAHTIVLLLPRRVRRNRLLSAVSPLPTDRKIPVPCPTSYRDQRYQSAHEIDWSCRCARLGGTHRGWDGKEGGSR